MYCHALTPPGTESHQHNNQERAQHANFSLRLSEQNPRKHDCGRILVELERDDATARFKAHTLDLQQIPKKTNTPTPRNIAGSESYNLCAMQMRPCSAFLDCSFAAESRTIRPVLQVNHPIQHKNAFSTSSQAMRRKIDISIYPSSQGCLSCSGTAGTCANGYRVRCASYVLALHR
jgi:hypothetical protein